MFRVRVRVGGKVKVIGFGYEVIRVMGLRDRIRIRVYPSKHQNA